MSPRTTVAQRLRQITRVTGFAGITATLLPMYSLRAAPLGPEARDAARERWVRRWARALLGLFQVEVEVLGTPPPAASPTGRLVVMNHRSTVDIGVALQVFGGILLSRGDLAGWPLLGVAARTAGTLFVDRKDSMSGAAAVRAITQRLRERATVTVFAEGTTFEGDEVRPFHGGAFVAAAGTSAELLPVGVAYARGSGAAFVNETFPQHLARMAASPPTRVVVAVGEPLVAEPGLRANALRARTHDAVTALVAKARAHVDGG